VIDRASVGLEEGRWTLCCEEALVPGTCLVDHGSRCHLMVDRRARFPRPTMQLLLHFASFQRSFSQLGLAVRTDPGASHRARSDPRWNEAHGGSFIQPAIGRSLSQVLPACLAIQNVNGLMSF